MATNFMHPHDRALYIGAVSLLVRLHASMGSSVESAAEKRADFNADGDPMARLVADFNAQDFGLVLVENGASWAMVERREAGDEA